MNTQINLRLPDKMLASIRSYTKKYGYSSVQDFIKETIREKLFEPDITSEDLRLVKKLIQVSEEKKLYGTEKELFDKLKR